MSDVFPYIAAAGIALAGGAFRGFAGFGSGLLMAPLLTLVFPPAVAVPSMLMLSLSASVRLVPEVWSEVHWRRVASVAIPAILTVPIGVYLLTGLDAETVRRAVSAMVLCLVAVLAMGVRYRGADRLRVLAPTGMVSGLLSGIGGVGGPPVVLAFLSNEEPPESTRADLIAYFALIQIAAIASNLFNGNLGSEQLWLYLAAAPMFLIAIHLGSKRFRGSGGKNYRPLALGFLAIVAAFGLFWP
jgi:uncharacterized membrane protein YfcA